MTDDIERQGLIREAAIALKWRPILSLIKQYEDASDTIQKAESAKKIFAFIIVTAFEQNPEHNKLYRLLSKILEFAKSDPDNLELLKDLFSCIK